MGKTWQVAQGGRIPSALRVIVTFCVLAPVMQSHD